MRDTVDFSPSPYEHADIKPYVAFVGSTCGGRTYLQMLLLAKIEEFFGRKIYEMGDLAAGTSGAAAALARLTIAGKKGQIEWASDILDEYLQSTRDVLSGDFSRVIKERRNPYSLETAQEIFRQHWGEVTLQHAQMDMILTAYDRRSQGTKFLSNYDEETKNILVIEAIASAISIPWLFKPKVLNGWKLSDGFRQQSFPIQKAIEIARHKTAETNRPLFVFGLTGCFSESTWDTTNILLRSRLIHGRGLISPRNQITQEIATFNGLKQAGQVDGIIFHADGSELVPEISDDISDLSDENISAMKKLANLIFDANAEELERIRNKVVPRLTQRSLQHA